MNTEQLLRTLDPSTEPTDTQQRRADALLQRIVIDPVETVTARPARSVRPQRNAWRVGALLAAGATIAAVAIAVPGLSPQSAAVASWTAEPEVVSSADLAVAETACLEHLVGTQNSANIPLSISERRGDIVALLFYQANPEASSACVLDLPPGAESPKEVTGGSGSSTGPAMVAADNSYVRGMEGQFAIGGQVFSVVSGSVGAGVASVTLRGADDEAVATITNGKYAAWVPGPMFERLDAPSGEGGPEAILFYDLTLDDGTVLRDALPEYRATE